MVTSIRSSDTEFYSQGDWFIGTGAMSIHNDRHKKDLAFLVSSYWSCSEQSGTDGNPTKDNYGKYLIAGSVDEYFIAT